MLHFRIEIYTDGRTAHIYDRTGYVLYRALV